MTRHAGLAAVKLLAVTAILLFLTAPTPGDTGGCGQARQELDEAAFFETRNAIGCERCQQCGFATERCSDACADVEPEGGFPEGCVPLVHDGEVCLRRLLDVSCDTYRDYVDDEAPRAPTECDFCPPRQP